MDSRSSVGQGMREMYGLTERDADRLPIVLPRVGIRIIGIEAAEPEQRQ